MLGLFNQKNGSITVFLSLILVPVLIFVSIMVDGAAFVLSKGMVESAGELASNAALADYDTVLKEVYGLFAMSQKSENPQEALQKNITEYFNNSLQASGVIPESVDWDSETMQWINDALNGAAGIEKASIGSLVNAGVEGTADVGYLQDSSLANPAVLRSQIVEYTKYRAPINVALSAVESLGAFKKANGQSTVLTKKTQVDDAYNKVTDKLEKFYKEIKEYDNQILRLEQAIEKGTGTELKIQDMENAMLLCHSIIINLQIEPLVTYNNGTYSSDFDTLLFLKEDGSFCKILRGGESAVTVKSMGVDIEIEKIQTEFQDAVENADTAVSSLGSHSSQMIGYGTFSGMTMDLPRNTSSSSNPTKLREALEGYTQISDALQKMEGCRLAIDKAKAPGTTDYPSEVYDVEVPEDVLSQGEDKVQEYKDKIIDQNKKSFREQKEAEFNGQKEDMKQSVQDSINRFIPISAIYMTALKNYESAYIQYDQVLRKTLKDINNLMNPILNEASIITKSINISWDWGDTHIGTKSENVIDKADDVRTYINELKGKLNEYKSSINNYEAAYANGDGDDFSAIMDGKYKEMVEQFKDEDIQQIIDQVDHTVRYLTNESGPVGLITAIDSLKLAGVSITGWWKDTNASDFKMNLKINEIIKQYKTNAVVTGKWSEAKNGTYGNLDQNTKELAAFTIYESSVMHKICSNPLNKFNSFNTGSNCYLKKIGEANVVAADHSVANIPPFYFYLATLFENTDTIENVNKANMEDMREDQENEAELQNNSNTDIVKLPDSIFNDVPSGSIGGEGSVKDKNKDGIFDCLRNSLSTFTDIFSALGNITDPENIVDTLLVTEYVLQDFSMYTDRSPEENGDYQTYSNVPVNAANNKMFGYETEYIIYGSKGTKDTKFLMFTVAEGKGPEVNINQAKANIFAVRMVFNMVFAMTDSTIDTQTKPPALAIQAASGGIFPYQVAQTVLKLCLALAESNFDVDKIMENEKMPLMKTKSTWQFQLANMNNMVSEKMDGVAQYAQDGFQKAVDMAGESLQSSADGLESSVSSMVKGTLENSIDSMIQNFTLEIESFYQKLLTQSATYSNTELRNICETALNSCLEKIITEEHKNLLNQKLKPLLMNVISPGGSIDGYFNVLVAEVNKTDIDVAGLAKNYSSMQKELAASAENARKAIDAEVEGSAGTIANEVMNSVEDALDEIKDQGTEVISDASAKLSAAVNDKMNEFFPRNAVDTQVGLGGGKSNAAVGKTFNMGYEDYLRVFLLVKLLSDNSDKVVTRIADVIQINVNEGLTEFKPDHPAKGRFRMSNAHTYIEIDTKIKVKPILINQEWFKNWKGESIQYLMYDYHTIAGY